jgi:hypothetical protein
MSERKYFASQTSEHKATYSASQLLSVTMLCSPPLFQLTARENNTRLHLRPNLRLSSKPNLFTIVSM